MKRIVLLVGLMLTACGGGGDGGTTAPLASSHAPVVSNLQYSPQTATLNQGGGAVNVTGSINFIDTGSDISSLTTTVFNAQGAQLSSTTTPVQNVAGFQQGVIAIATAGNTSVATSYSFQISVTDAAGNPSNKLTGTFTVN